jgi:uncharacterized protein YciI
MNRYRSAMRIVIACLLVALSSSTVRAEEPPAADKHFVVQFTVGPAWVEGKAPNEQAYFADHSANLKRLRAEGKLLLGGRYSDKGIIIVTGPSEEAVRAEIEKDPSVRNGTFVAAIHPFSAFYTGCVE